MPDYLNYAPPPTSNRWYHQCYVLAYSLMPLQIVTVPLEASHSKLVGRPAAMTDYIATLVVLGTSLVSLLATICGALGPRRFWPLAIALLTFNAGLAQCWLQCEWRFWFGS
jgi:hypothetical protein